MTLFIVTTDKVGAGIQLGLAAGDVLYVPTALLVQSTANDAVQSSGSGISVQVKGTVLGGGAGMLLGNNSSLKGQTLEVGAHGTVGGTFYGAYLSGFETRVTNAGEVFGGNSGLVIEADGGSGSTVINSGTIIGQFSGILRNGGPDTGKLTIQNSGVIEGGFFSLLTNTANTVESIRNTGSMIGNIDLNGGNDRYDGRGGHMTGQVSAGDGVDRLIGGKGREVFEGQYGADQLTGGKGNDVFVFGFLADSGDAITDFTNKAGNNDQFQIDASNFSGGLVAGALAASQFRVRADNHAQDANDRFIFRTTDATLWYDQNGSAAGALIMVADLQASAHLTAADILLI